MPGVPSGKGCDACRKQKKKCDLGKPACSRCTRLRISCIGAGQQRFVFKDHSASVKRTSSDSSSEQPRSSQSATPDPSVAAGSRALSRSPSNDLSALASALVQAVKPETSWRFNIAYAYGGFVALIPPRLGRNAALDASVSALTEAHADFCNQRPASRRVLTRYSHALTQLRVCLSDPQVATQADTLCAVMLLLITQSFIGTGDARPAASHSHIIGMAKLLKVRGTHHDPQDPFESLLLLTLRGPVVFEGLWNDQIQFSEAQWRALVDNHWDGDQRTAGFMMRCMAKMPLFVLRGRKVLKGEAVDPTLAQELDTVYQQLLGERTKMEQRLADLEYRVQYASVEVAVLTQIRDAVMRIHSFHLAVIIISGCVLGVVSGFTTELQDMLNDCARKIYDYVPWVQRWRPLGASYMLLSLSMAWVGTDDAELKAELLDAYIEQCTDFPADLDSGSIAECLETGAKKFLSLGVDWIAKDEPGGRLGAEMPARTMTLPERNQVR